MSSSRFAIENRGSATADPAADGGEPEDGAGVEPTSTHPPRRRISPISRQWLSVAGASLVMLAIWQLGSSLGVWSESVIPLPADVLEAASEIVGTAVFWDAMATTVLEVVASFAGSLVIGFALGALFWKAPYVGRLCEPYLVSFYAVPFIVFYPVLVVVLGLNSWPIIVIATAMGTIPMALNTWIGLASVRAVYWKLGASLGCNRRQTLRRIALPAAAPIMLSGIRLAGIYSFIGSVSMEFLLAPNGLGFQIRYLYEKYEQAPMLFYMVVVFVVASVVALLIASLEWRVVGRTQR